MTKVSIDHPLLDDTEDDAAAIESFLADFFPPALEPATPVPDARPQVVRARPEPEHIRVLIPLNQAAPGVRPLKTPEARRLAKALLKSASGWLSNACEAIARVELASVACWMGDDPDDLAREVRYLSAYAAHGALYPSLLGRGLAGPALPRFVALDRCPVEGVESIFRAACARACVASMRPVRVDDLATLLGVQGGPLGNLARDEGALTDDSHEVHPLWALLWLAAQRAVPEVATSDQPGEEPR